MVHLPAVSISAEVKIDHTGLRRELDATRSEISRTLAIEALEVSTEEIGTLGAVDTGAMRASGHVMLPGGAVDELADAAGSARSEALSPEWRLEEPGEAVVAYGAAYAEHVHEGHGSNAKIGPRPFLANAGKDVSARPREIAGDVVRRRYGA